MTKRIFSLITDLKLEQDLANNIRRRSLDQKFLYIGENVAEAYYEIINPSGNYTQGFSPKDSYEFIKKQLNINQKTAIISLGCGDASPEAFLLKHLAKDGYNIDYFGM